MVKKAKQHFNENPISWALAALFIGGVCIGTSPIFVRLSEVGPSASAFWRILLVLPLFYMTMERKVKVDQDIPLFKNKKIMWGLFMCGFLFAADLAFWHWALQFTTVANATLLSNLMPIVVAVGAYFIFKEKLTKTFYFGLFLALTGAVLLAGGSRGEGQLLGNSLGVITAIFYGAYLLYVRWLRHMISTSFILFWTGVVSVLFLLPLAYFSNEVILPITNQGWLTLFGLAFISQFLGQGLITYSLAHLPSAFGAVSLLIQPIVATAIAWPLFGEALSTTDLLAASIILMGIVMARLGSVKRNTT